ncbi:hypothetical protein TSMEX_009178 [Taenia solium]|eukprot:TsM_001227200 transcript=TsM_001227200 gene=TsM_001227200
MKTKRHMEDYRAMGSPVELRVVTAGYGTTPSSSTTSTTVSASTPKVVEEVAAEKRTEAASTTTQLHLYLSPINWDVEASFAADGFFDVAKPIQLTVKASSKYSRLKSARGDQATWKNSFGHRRDCGGIAPLWQLRFHISPAVPIQSEANLIVCRKLLMQTIF